MGYPKALSTTRMVILVWEKPHLLGQMRNMTLCRYPVPGRAANSRPPGDFIWGLHMFSLPTVFWDDCCKLLSKRSKTSSWFNLEANGVHVDLGSIQSTHWVLHLPSCDSVFSRQDATADADSIRCSQNHIDTGKIIIPPHPFWFLGFHLKDKECRHGSGHVATRLAEKVRAMQSWWQPKDGLLVSQFTATWGCLKSRLQRLNHVTTILLGGWPGVSF